jgi:hypothetical protein
MDNTENNDNIPLEDVETEELTFDEMYPEEELDEETLNLIYNTNVVEIDFTTDKKLLDLKVCKGKAREKKEKKEKEKPIEISLDELVEKNKTSAWISVRTKDKKTDKTILAKAKEPRFKFNPRLPPYNMIHKSYNEEVTNMKATDEKLFPKL